MLLNAYIMSQKACHIFKTHPKGNETLQETHQILISNAFPLYVQHYPRKPCRTKREGEGYYPANKVVPHGDVVTA